MRDLYQQIQKQPYVGSLLNAVDRVIKSNMLPTIKNKLIQDGYNLSKLSDKGVAILFCALNDILYVVRDNDFYIVTLCQDKITELMGMQRIVNRQDETNYQKTSQVVYGNTKELINQFLLQGKFHFIKLNPIEDIRYQYFMVTLSGMNPYPSLDTETVYTLTDLNNWHNELYNNLRTYCLNLTVNNTKVTCTSYKQKDISLSTSGELLTRDINSEPVRYYLWSITSYEKYSKNDFVMKLLNGVVKYDNKYITLNREILEKYYGSNLYKNLESIGVRRKYCLEEITSLGVKYGIPYYISKYNLDIYDCDTMHEFRQRLNNLVDIKPCDTNYINARVLINYNQINAGHKSFYVKVDLSALMSHVIETVDNIEAVLPKIYRYYAISKSIGYSYVEVSATSEALAMQYGKTEFTRQFGEEVEFCSLVWDNTVIKGYPVFSIGIEVQRELCQQLMYGYKENYQGYSRVLRQICSTNNINDISDDAIKYLFANNVAKLYNKGLDPKLEGVSSVLIKFLTSIYEGKLFSLLKDEYTKLAYKNCIREYSGIIKAYPNYDGYKISDTVDGRFIITENGRYRFKADNTISVFVDLYHNNEFLCTRKITKEG